MTKTAIMKTYKSPLTVYVIWHPAFEQGEKFANAIYSTFCRDIANPLSRGINIPVFYRSESFEDNTPIEIPYNESDMNALIILVDEKMFEDDNWRKYIRTLSKGKPDNTRLFPIALSQYAYHIDEKVLGKNQFIKADEMVGSDSSDLFTKQWRMIKSRLLHDLSRQLLNLNSFYKANKSDDPPVTLFLSHAKKDGELLATQFRDHIESNTKLNTFFDANDIADGHNFEVQIKENAENSALIVFQSDEYSNREWCRIEVITAKRFMAPIVLVHDIKKGEKRTFPYLGNAPSVKWENNIDEIIDLTLLQVLSKYFNAAKLNKYIEQYNLEDKHSCLPLSKPPELFNYIDIEKMKKKEKNNKPYLVLYPDPPLGIEELNLLNDVDDKIEFITPILLPSYLNQK
ncbi:MAG: toll/interleukin-1 receptor domain-containing protein [Bacteroidia bacterium]